MQTAQPSASRPWAWIPTLYFSQGVPYVVDCGYGTSRQLVSAGVALNTVRHIFITHHHSDHNLELGAIPYNAWAAGSFGRIDVYGPPGLERMNRAFLDYLAVLEQVVRDAAAAAEQAGKADAPPGSLRLRPA